MKTDKIYLPLPIMKRRNGALRCLLLLLFIVKPSSATPLVFERTLAAKLEQTLASQPKVSLTVSPEQCVAMQQGQNCYVAVELFWQAQGGQHTRLWQHDKEKAESSVVEFFNRYLNKPNPRLIVADSKAMVLSPSH